MQPRPKTKQLPHIISVCLFLALAITIFRGLQTPSPASETSANDAVTIDIAPGTSIQHKLAAGATASFSVSITGGSLLRFSIDKGDFVVSTTLYGPTGTKLLEHLSQDFEVVDLSFPAQTPGSYRIELRSRETVETRQFELRLQPLTAITPINQKDSDARQALARAEVLRAESTETAFRQAIEQFDQATQIWLSLFGFTSASQASLKSGDVLADLGEYQEALKRYQDANLFAQKTGDWLAKATALSRIARVECNLGKNNLAQEHVDESLDLFRQHEGSLNAGATNAYAEARCTLAEVLYSRAGFVKAKEQFYKALEMFQGDRGREAKAHLFLGYIFGTIGDANKASDESSLALNLYRAIQNKRGEGLALVSLGLTHSFHDESKAIEFYSQARDIFNSLGDKTSEAIALNGLGQASQNLNDASALNYYQQALALFEEKQLAGAITTNLIKIAEIYFSKGSLDKALEYDERCLKSSQQMGNARLEAVARTEIAKVYTAQKLYDLASAEYQKVRHFYESTKDLRGQTMALNADGDFLLQVGEKQKAVDSFNRALALSDELKDKELLIDSLYNVARAHFQLGSLEQALSSIERSLKEIEDLRSSVESPDFRASYFSGVQENYKLEIEILMQLERVHPGDGFLSRAFLANESSRSRLLRELVLQSPSEKRGGASELLQRERELRGRYRAQAQYRLNLSAEQKNSTEVADLDRELDQIKTEYRVVEAQLRRQNYGLPTLVEPLTLEQIQHELRDSNTILLQFSLGDERSYLFVVTFNSIRAYELPARKVVEDAAHEYRDLITVQEQGQSARNYQGKVEAAEKLLFAKGGYLSRMLLGQVRDELGDRRLVIVAEGALQIVPFEALPVPVEQSENPTAAKTLLETNEIVFEPSISTLAAIRKAPRHKSAANKLVAIIADPVVGRSDERVQNQSLSSGIALAATNTNSDQSLQQSSMNPVRAGALTRLVHASEEADAISAAAPWGTTMVAKGFAANRETAMSSDVGQYQIVHFATHGFFDSEHPEMSGIVLTMVDPNGANTNGVMPLQDIYSLDLSAELTVLSACQTALGKDIKGEGLVGLTHGFMSAGSKTVVASLWKVDDRATAVLMAEFYKSMFQGMAPAAALRSAKLKMMHDKQWSAPYYWAGFVLQGEYENHIDVDRYSSLRLALMLLLLLSLTVAGLLFYRRRKRRFSPPQSS
jgi:tetratricopeptide (TPR) repeat protein